jgi:hypothetical protein
MTNATRPHPRRDLLLDRLRARLARLTEEDAGPVFEPSALADVRALVEAVPDLEADLQVAREVGWFHWFRLVLGPEGGGGPDDHDHVERAFAMFALVYPRHRAACALPSAEAEGAAVRRHPPGPVVTLAGAQVTFETVTGALPAAGWVHFYSALAAPERVEPAYALHRAVVALRDLVPERPSLWASHLHAGP